MEFTTPFELCLVLNYLPLHCWVKHFPNTEPNILNKQKNCFKPVMNNYLKFNFFPFKVIKRTATVKYFDTKNIQLNRGIKSYTLFKFGPKSIIFAENRNKQFFAFFSNIFEVRVEVASKQVVECVECEKTVFIPTNDSQHFSNPNLTGV